MAEIYTLNKRVNKLELTYSNISKNKNKLKWIDLKHPSEEEVKILKEKLLLHPITIEDLRLHNTRTKIEEFPNYLSVVIYDIYRKGEDVVNQISNCGGRAYDKRFVWHVDYQTKLMNAMKEGGIF